MALLVVAVMVYTGAVSEDSNEKAHSFYMDGMAGGILHKAARGLPAREVPRYLRRLSQRV